MAELVLQKDLRLALKAQAHAVDAVVRIGAAGLSQAALGEIDRALVAHGLIKVRVPRDDRTEREAIFAAIAERLGAARIQAIGKMIVVYRPPPPDAPPAPSPATAPRRTRSAAQGRRRSHS
jgi:RNA-binding protein